MPDDLRCPRCGSRLSADAESSGLCPVCVLTTALDDAPVVASGARIGPYRILDTLGEGGMGIVYLAEQDEPIRRRVALKVIKVGMDTREVVRRFDSERRALALMDHPNIARVLDARASADGRPYFVMEYVPGLPITTFCDRHHFSTAARLELMQQVCAAVQHAHQRGVIHRDLKPSNVLVKLEDDRAVAKVIDFGVARAIDQDSLLTTIFTEQGCLVGTPEYMSPEQASLGATTIDTQTDIYSLGVLLYELLAGGLPFDVTTLRQAGYDEMRRIIREVDPIRPSTRVSTLGAGAEAVATSRRTHPEGLQKQLRGDLDWITLRALEKDPARRYASASEVAADIGRHLRFEPVLAGPPSTTYRAGKFVRKHRVAVAVASLFVILLASAALVSTALYVQAEAARRESERRRVQADEARDATERQRRAADSARIEASQQRQTAEAQAQVAQAARSEAEQQRDAAERRSYVSNIASADLRVTAGEIREAKRLLDLCPPRLRGWEWGYLRREADASIATLKAPSGPDPERRIQQFEAVRFTPDRLLALGTLSGSASRSDAMAAFELAGGTPKSAAATLVTLDTHRSVLAVSADGRRLLVTRWYGTRPSARPIPAQDDRGSGGMPVELRITNPDLPEEDRGRVFVIDTSSRASIAALTLDAVGIWRGRARDATAIALAPPAPGGRYGTITEDRRPLVAVNMPVPVRGALSLDGTRAAAWSWDNAIHVWDVASGRASAPLTGHTDLIVDAFFSADQRRLVSGSRDATVRTWDLESGHPIAVIGPYPSPVTAIAITPDGSVIAAALQDRTIRLSQDGKPEPEAMRGHTGLVTSLAFDREGRRLVSTSEDRTVRVWNTQSGIPVLVFRGHEDTVTGADFAADEQRIATSSLDGTVRLWNAAASVDAFAERSRQVHGVAFLDNGSVVSGHGDDVLRVWSLASGGIVRQTTLPAEISSLSVNAPLHRVAAGLVNRATRTQRAPGISALIMDSETLRTVATLTGQDGVVQSVALSADGRLAASGADSDRTVRLWDAISGREVSRWETGAARALAFSPDDGRVAGALAATTSLMIWPLGQRAASGNLSIGSGTGLPAAAAVAFTPDGTRVISGHADGLLRVWDVQSGRRLADLPGHDLAVQAIAVSPDGSRVASAGADRTVRIWSTETRELLLTLRTMSPVQSLAFSADGDRLAAGLLGGTIRVWYSRPPEP